MKKLISILCAVAMIAAFTCIGASAADTLVTLSLVPQAVAEGATEIAVDLVASVADGQNITSLGVVVDYDSEALTLAKVESAIEGAYSEGSQNPTADPYSWVFVLGTTSVTGETVIGTFTFNINAEGGAVLDTKYDFTLSALERGNVVSLEDHDFTAAEEVAFVNGSVTVAAGYMIGDLDGNEKCDSNDVIVLLRKLAGWENVTTAPDEAADVDGSGKVDSNDAIYYLRSLAGWADHDIG